jgi:hypothetical protein
MAFGQRGERCREESMTMPVILAIVCVIITIGLVTTMLNDSRHL